ncbi:MAG: hypothetical protein QXH07_05810, partial [Thermoplasmata archaeon]
EIPNGNSRGGNPVAIGGGVIAGAGYERHTSTSTKPHIITPPIAIATIRMPEIPNGTNARGGNKLIGIGTGGVIYGTTTNLSNKERVGYPFIAKSASEIPNRNNGRVGNSVEIGGGIIAVPGYERHTSTSTKPHIITPPIAIATIRMPEIPNRNNGTNMRGGKAVAVGGYERNPNKAGTGIKVMSGGGILKDIGGGIIKAQVIPEIPNGNSRGGNPVEIGGGIIAGAGYERHTSTSTKPHIITPPIAIVTNPMPEIPNRNNGTNMRGGKAIAEPGYERNKVVGIKGVRAFGGSGIGGGGFIITPIRIKRLTGLL